jgi:hypothetical protein
MPSPFCRASAANRCCFEAACLRKVLVWRLQPVAFTYTNGLILQRPFVPRIAERWLYQRQTLQPTAQYSDATGFTCNHECGDPGIRAASFHLVRWRAYLHVLHCLLRCFRKCRSNPGGSCHV